MTGRPKQKIGYLRSIMAHYWAISADQVMDIKSKHVIYYEEVKNQGISFNGDTDTKDIEYIDVIITAERILESKELLKILISGNTSILTDNFIADHFFKLCREAIAEHQMVCTSKEIYALIDFLFTLDFNKLPDKYIDRSILERFVDLDKLANDFDVTEEVKSYIHGAFKHIRHLLILKAGSYKVSLWAGYLTHHDRYPAPASEFNPIIASKELGLIYLDQFAI